MHREHTHASSYAGGRAAMHQRHDLDDDSSHGHGPSPRHQRSALARGLGYSWRSLPTLRRGLCCLACVALVQFLALTLLLTARHDDDTNGGGAAGGGGGANTNLALKANPASTTSAATVAEQQRLIGQLRRELRAARLAGNGTAGGSLLALDASGVAATGLIADDGSVDGDDVDPHVRYTRSLTRAAREFGAEPIDWTKPWTPKPASVLRDRLAWAVPVGGKQERNEMLEALLTLLIEQGAGRDNIFVFEDDGSRVNGEPSAALDEIARRFGVHLVRSNQPVVRGENLRIGRHLAKHFRFMMEYLYYQPVSTHGTPYRYMACIEDDLKLSVDAVKYFQEMSQVMDMDDSVFCVSGRVDNGFSASTRDFYGERLPRASFQFRRGNHFMAPGWMSSKKIYERMVRPAWLTVDGQHLTRNIHWDNYMETVISTHVKQGPHWTKDKWDCIFPEVSRTVHMGGGGFTVDPVMQMERFGNLRVSQMSVNVDFGDLRYLTLPGYDREIAWFIERAVPITRLHQIERFRHTRLVIHIEADSQTDQAWNVVFAGHMGIYGVGGYPDYSCDGCGWWKMRGVHRGVAVAKWMTNIVMVIGSYSPYFHHFERIHGPQHFAIEHHGCYRDSAEQRLLPYQIGFFVASAGPDRCVFQCNLNGYRYAGLQNGEECWCGQGPLPAASKIADGDCNKRCIEMDYSRRYYEAPCGSDWKVSVYTRAPPDDAKAVGGAASDSGSASAQRLKAALVLKPTQDGSLSRYADRVNRLANLPLDYVPSINNYPEAPIEYIGAGGKRVRPTLQADDWKVIKARAGQTCTEACRDDGQRCDDQLMALIMRDCERLTTLLGCTRGCRYVPDMTAGLAFSAPLVSTTDEPTDKVEKGVCYLSKGMFVQCKGQPRRDTYTRACVCTAGDVSM